MPPDVTILTHVSSYYGIAGYEEFEQWALRNDPHFKDAWLQCEQLGIHGEHRLRLILVAMTRKAHAIAAAQVAEIERCGVSSYWIAREGGK